MSWTLIDLGCDIVFALSVAALSVLLAFGFQL